jgi:hypothetical protein
MENDGSTTPSGRIDFTEEEELHMHRLAWGMKVVGLLQSVLAGLGLLMALLVVVTMFPRMVQVPVLALAAVLLLLVTGLPVYQGIVLREAGEYVELATRGDDDSRDNIMSMFRRLRVVYVLEAVVVSLLAFRALA